MNWFDILKNAGLAQRQQQGISARQKDEDFVFEDEDENDCYNEFLGIIDKVMASFPNSAINRWRQAERSESSEFKYDDFLVSVDAVIAEKGKIPDEVYCAAIEMAKIQHQGRKSVRPTDTGYQGKYVGDYFVRSTKNQEIYFITISPKERQQDDLVSKIIIRLYVPDGEGDYKLAYRNKDKEYSLHKDFDNWRGLF